MASEYVAGFVTLTGWLSLPPRSTRQAEDPIKRRSVGVGSRVSGCWWSIKSLVPVPNMSLVSAPFSPCGQTSVRLYGLTNT